MSCIALHHLLHSYVSFLQLRQLILPFPAIVNQSTIITHINITRVLTNLGEILQIKSTDKRTQPEILQILGGISRGTQQKTIEVAKSTTENRSHLQQ